MVIAPHLIDEKTRLKQQLNAKPFERAFEQRETKEKLHRNFLKRHSSPTFVDSARKRRQRALNFHFTLTTYFSFRQSSALFSSLDELFLHAFKDCENVKISSALQTLQRSVVGGMQSRHTIFKHIALKSPQSL